MHKETTKDASLQGGQHVTPPLWDPWTAQLLLSQQLTAPWSASHPAASAAAAAAAISAAAAPLLPPPPYTAPTSAALLAAATAVPLPSPAALASSLPPPPAGLAYAAALPSNMLAPVWRPHAPPAAAELPASLASKPAKLLAGRKRRRSAKAELLPIGEAARELYSQCRYPSRPQLLSVCRQTGASLKQLRKWFDNRRARDKQAQLRKQKLMQEMEALRRRGQTEAGEAADAAAAAATASSSAGGSMAPPARSTAAAAGSTSRTESKEADTGSSSAAAAAAAAAASVGGDASSLTALHHFRRRQSFTAMQRAVLESAYRLYRGGGAFDACKLAEQLCVSRARVTKWLDNRRATRVERLYARAAHGLSRPCALFQLGEDVHNELLSFLKVNDLAALRAASPAAQLAVYSATYAAHLVHNGAWRNPITFCRSLLNLRALRTLSFSSTFCQHSTALVAFLHSLRKATALHKLTLDVQVQHEYRTRPAQALATSLAAMPQLRVLELRNSEVGLRDVVAIMAALSGAEHLTSFICNGRRHRWFYCPRAVAHRPLSVPALPPRLRTLDLTGHVLGMGYTDDHGLVDAILSGKQLRQLSIAAVTRFAQVENAHTHRYAAVHGHRMRSRRAGRADDAGDRDGAATATALAAAAAAAAAAAGTGHLPAWARLDRRRGRRPGGGGADAADGEVEMRAPSARLLSRLHQLTSLEELHVELLSVTLNSLPQALQQLLDSCRQLPSLRRLSLHICSSNGDDADAVASLLTRQLPRLRALTQLALEWHGADDSQLAAVLSSAGSMRCVQRVQLHCLSSPVNADELAAQFALAGKQLHWVEKACKQLSRVLP